MKSMNIIFVLMILFTVNSALLYSQNKPKLIPAKSGSGIVAPLLVGWPAESFGIAQPDVALREWDFNSLFLEPSADLEIHVGPDGQHPIDIAQDGADLEIE